MRDMSRWEAAGYGGLLGAIIGPVFAAGGAPKWQAAVLLACAAIAAVSLTAAPNRGWLTRGLPAAYAAVAAIAWAAGQPGALLHAAPCAACTVVCAATVRRANTRKDTPQ
nr:MAG TPA: hypothetical protein [Caudoviricetes sp.]